MTDLTASRPQSSPLLSRRTLLAGAGVLAASGAAALVLPGSSAYAATKKQLPYTWQVQQNSWCCSAASAQMALNARHVIVSQDALSSELNLNSDDGLPDINNVPPVLNRHLNTSVYRVRNCDASSYAGTLDADVRANIDHGFALMLNVTCFHRGPDTIVQSNGHYVALVGYSDTQYYIGDPASRYNGPGFWFSKASVRSWNKMYRYVAGTGFASTTPTPPPPATTWPTLRSGSRGTAVTVLQYLLRAHGSTIAADGAFGSGTASAVSAFQAKSGLTKDGVAGSATWGKVVVTVKQGSTGDSVRAAQTALNAHHVKVAVDGQFGSGTKSAVVAYQRANRLSADGIVGTNTWGSFV